jgi:hypothetical protein
MDIIVTNMLKNTPKKQKKKARLKKYLLTCSSTTAWTVASVRVGLPITVSACEPSMRTRFKINCTK